MIDYLCQGGYVFIIVCISVCLSVCLFVSNYVQKPSGFACLPPLADGIWGTAPTMRATFQAHRSPSLAGF